MRTLLLGLVVVSACSSNSELESKVETLQKEVAALKAERGGLERKIDLLSVEVAKTASLEQKLDELKAKAMPPPRPTYPRRNEPDPAKTYAATIGIDHVEGPADAKVTMVWAHDYACPYCERVRPTIAELRTKYGNDLRVVYRPLVVHPTTATAPALASCAAERQHKFTQMDKLLWDTGFKNRKFDVDANGMHCWISPLGCPVVLGFARQIGLDVSKFKTDMAACEPQLEDTMRELQGLGARATPSFYINGRYLSGARPIEDYAAIIDEELAKANARIQQGAKQATYYKDYVIDQGLTSVDP